MQIRVAGDQMERRQRREGMGNKEEITLHRWNNICQTAHYTNNRSER